MTSLKAIPFLAEESEDCLSLAPLGCEWVSDQGAARVTVQVTPTLRVTVRQRRELFAQGSGKEDADSTEAARSTGGLVWDAGIALLAYLTRGGFWRRGSFPTAGASFGRASEETPPASQRVDFLQGLHVLELGSGCGLLGIALARLGLQVTCTDKPEPPELLENLRQNVQDNLLSVATSGSTTTSRTASTTSSARDAGHCAGTQVRVRPLTWVEDEVTPQCGERLCSAQCGAVSSDASVPLDGAEILAGNYDVVVAADCIYDPYLVVPLLDTAGRHAVPLKTTILVAFDTALGRERAYERLFQELRAREEEGRLQWREIAISRSIAAAIQDDAADDAGAGYRTGDTGGGSLKCIDLGSVDSVKETVRLLEIRCLH